MSKLSDQIKERRKEVVRSVQNPFEQSLKLYVLDELLWLQLLAERKQEEGSGTGAAKSENAGSEHGGTKTTYLSNPPKGAKASAPDISKILPPESFWKFKSNNPNFQYGVRAEKFTGLVLEIRKAGGNLEIEDWIYSLSKDEAWINRRKES